MNQTTKATFDEITDHLLNDYNPSEYFNGLDKGLRKYLLSMIRELKNVEQSPKYQVV